MNGPPLLSAPRKLDETLEDYSRQIHRQTLAAFFDALLRYPSKLSNFVVDVFDNGILHRATEVGSRTARETTSARPSIRLRTRKYFV